MRGDVWELYVVCFELLTEVFTEWSSSWGKRFWKSFDKNAANKLFASKKAAIASLTIKLDRAAKVDTERVVQQYLPNVVTKEHLEEALLQHLHNVVIQEHLSEAILILGTRLFIQAVGGGARCEQGLAERNETAEPATMVSTSSHVDDNSELTKPIIRKQGFGCPDIMASNQKIAMFLYHPLDELKRLQDRASHLDIDRRIVSRLH